MINLELNKKSFKLCNKLIKESRKLNIGTLSLRNDAKIIDCGINHIGGFEAAKIVTEMVKVSCFIIMCHPWLLHAYSPPKAAGSLVRQKSQQQHR